ncbi:MAG TPA: DUF2232 domain-containing protein [Microvirga sp.]|jgi:hypothetical protein|nr:DUF2232 domain-containing protein [Microvirga sp.]
MKFLAIGIGAGLVSALLFGVVITGSPLAMLLSYVAPLPVLITALGWNHRSGLVAAVAGGLATALAFRFEAGLAFVVGSALPAWWVAYLALLGRPNADGTMEWYPVGRLLLWVAAAAALVTLAGVMALGSGDYEGYRTALRTSLAAILRSGATPPPQGAAPDTVENLVDTLVSAVPYIASAVFALVFTLNLWLAARVVQTSQRLIRPWPYLPATAMPRQALLLMAGAIVLSLAPGFIGVAGLSLAGALTIAFALQGLAFVHETTRGRNARVAILTGLYVLIVFVGHTVLPLLAVLGMADIAMALRQRLASRAAGPKTPPL